MLITTRALVISALKYGEADLIVRAFTLSDGLKTYMLKGVLKSKKGKLKSSLFQPLTQLEVVANHRNKGSMEYLREAKLSRSYVSLHTHVVKSAMTIFLSEVLRNSIREEEANPSLYHFLETSFIYLDEADQIGNFHLLFLLELSGYLGFYPEASRQELPYFNLLEGRFEPEKTSNYGIEDENLQTLRQFLGTNFDKISEIKLNQKSRQNFLNLMLLYYELHIEGFKKPRSLAVFHEIFS